MSESSALQDSAVHFADAPAGVTARRRLGAFYTPDELATSLVHWALAGKPGRLLEPSFGGCSFLRASIAEAVRLGGSPADVVGADIDEASAAPGAEELIADGLPRENVIYRDFLKLAPSEIGRFRAVVGNPPFVRHHWQHADWQRSGQELMRAAGVSVSQRASAWAYFLVHAVSLLEPNGRLAFVLPGSALHADYATSVLTFLEGRFAEVRLLRLRERVFDAQEEAVIVLADRLGAGPSEARAADVDSVEALSTLLGAPVTTAGLSVPEIKWGVLTKATRGLLTEVLADKRVSRLASIATVRIGVVTGANDVFVRTPQEIPDLVGVRGFPVISRSAWLTAPAFRQADFAARDHAGDRTRLLVIDGAWRRRGQLAEELTAWEAEGIDERSHCRRRKRWYCLSDTDAPEAFLPYMGALPRGLVLNHAQATCTNAIHRINFADDIDPPTAATSTWTSLFQVCAEIYGRHYGGGVLKLEPTAAGSLPVIARAAPSTHLDNAFAAFAARDSARGRDLLDQLFLIDELGLDQGDVDALKKAARDLKRWREETRDVERG
jgi:adenine-specific DNA-methyltransferase